MLEDCQMETREEQERRKYLTRIGSKLISMEKYKHKESLWQIVSETRRRKNKVKKAVKSFSSKPLRAFARSLNARDPHSERWMKKFLPRKIDGMGYIQNLPYKGFIIDFAYPTRKIAIEVDDPSHDKSLQKTKDIVKDQWLRNDGWKIFRIKAWDNDKAQKLVQHLFEAPADAEFLKRRSQAIASELQRRTGKSFRKCYFWAISGITKAKPLPTLPLTN